LVPLAYNNIRRKRRGLRAFYNQSGGNMRKLILQRHRSRPRSGRTGIGAIADRLKFSHVVATNTPRALPPKSSRNMAEKYTPARSRVEVYPNSQLYKDKEDWKRWPARAVQMLGRQTRIRADRRPGISKCSICRTSADLKNSAKSLTGRSAPKALEAARPQGPDRTSGRQDVRQIRTLRIPDADGPEFRV